MLNHIKKERPFSFHDETKLSFDWMAGSEEELERKEIFSAFRNGLRELARDVDAGTIEMTARQREETLENIRLLYENYLLDRETDVFALAREEKIPTKAQHFNRNHRMPPDILPQTPEEADRLGWDDGVAADCHQFTSPDKTHRKYVSPDGKLEVIFDKDGNMVTASEDYGTYNFASPNENPIGHFYMDVLPWIVWGNDEKDTTDLSMRLRAFVVDGGINMLKSKTAAKERRNPQ